MAKKPTRDAPSPCRFRIPADADLDDLLADLRSRFTVRSEPARTVRRRYYDSFGWRLYEQNRTLYAEDTGRRRLLGMDALAGDEPSHALRVRTVPQDAADLPPGPVRDLLEALMPLRALLPVAEVRCRRRVLRLLNADEKTVARLVVEDEAEAYRPGSDTPAPLGALLAGLPVKGYGAAIRKLCAYLAEDRGLPAHPRHPLIDALHALEVTPTSYSSRPDVDVAPTLRADEAVKHILSRLLEIMALNEPGLRANLDTEFLHDYRVAVRRTRSILSQLKAVFPASVRAEFGPAFKWLGGVTGPTRDLDVYLLRFPTYLSWLPDDVQTDLTPLRAFLESAQQREHARLVARLDDPRYAALIQAWQAYLAAPPPQPAPTLEAAQPVRDVASRRIWRAYRNVLKQGTAIQQANDAPPAALHALRIACKKLRYLMEVFASLYPADRISLLIRILKRLQDNLGDFQDFEVQQHQLQRFALDMMTQGDVPPETFLAMGRLEAHLAVLQQQAHDAFAARFARFARAKNQKKFARLFHSQG